MIGLAGGAALAAVLGLTGCDGAKDDGTDGLSAGAELQNGSPASASLDQLPLPEQGKLYNNPLGRDQIRDGGDLVLPLSELGPNWNYFSVGGNSTYMKALWANYMPINLFLVSADASSFTPNPAYLSDYREEMVDGKEVCTLTFRDEATFNDGTPMDYRAIKAVWDVMGGKDPAYEPSATDGYANIESVSPGATDKVAVVTFAAPYYPAQNILGQALHPAAVDPEVFANGWEGEPHVEWGAGPFIVDSLVEGQVVFKRNPSWWGDAPKLDSITYIQMDDLQEIDAFKKGEIDATSEGVGSMESLSNFQGLRDVEIRRGFGTSTRVFELNVNSQVMQDDAVRKAFWQCINAPTIVSIVYEGVNWKEETCGSFLINPWMSGYEDNRPDYISGNTTQDAQIAAARKTLEDAGYELGGDGIFAKDDLRASFGLLFFGDSNTSKNIVTAVQKMARGAGMEVHTDNRSSAQFSDELDSGAWDVAMFAWGASPASYNDGVQIFGSGSGSNYTHAGSEELDQRFSEIVGMSDHSERMAAFNEAEREVLKTNAFIPIYNGASVVCTKKGLANYGPALLATVLPEDIGWAKE